MRKGIAAKPHTRMSYTKVKKSEEKLNFQLQSVDLIYDIFFCVSLTSLLHCHEFFVSFYPLFCLFFSPVSVDSSSRARYDVDFVRSCRKSSSVDGVEIESDSFFLISKIHFLFCWPHVDTFLYFFGWFIGKWMRCAAFTLWVIKFQLCAGRLFGMRSVVSLQSIRRRFEICKIVQ